VPEDTSPADPEQTVLHRIVREHLATFLSRPRALPRFVRDELFAYLRCGVPAHGVARFACGGCGRDRVVALSCGGRGFCPRCLGRRMTKLAMEWTRFVLPAVRIRQWVLSVPFELRAPLGYRHELALAVHAVAARAIEARYRAAGRALGVPDGRTGMLTVVQRFGGDLALNWHTHSLVPDGVFDERGAFVPIAAPSAEQVQQLAVTIARRVARLFERRAASDELDDDERELGAVLARSAERRGAAALRDPDHDGPAWAGLVKGRAEGFDLECTTVVRAGDRDRLEHLCRYLLRPPLADRRLRLVGEPRAQLVQLELKTPWRDGTSWVEMTPLTFLERLTALVPRPRQHAILYRGVLASHAARRRVVVPAEHGPRPKNPTWCALAVHGLSIDVLRCECGGRMKLAAVVLRRQGLARLLRAHGLKDRALPISPARAPPQAELDFGA
jgi:hypothetical protein